MMYSKLATTKLTQQQETSVDVKQNSMTYQEAVKLLQKKDNMCRSC